MATPAHVSMARSERTMTERSKRDDRGYQPPMLNVIRTMTVGALLAGKRQIAPEQQARFGFEAEGLELPVWCAGDTELVQKRAVSIVGTRAVSPNGAARA